MSQEYIEITEKTVDDAITTACQKLSVTSHRLDYIVVQREKSGFLGIGAKPAIIKARIKDASDLAQAILDKDAEIDAFVPEDYWNLSCDVTPGAKKDSFTVKYYGSFENGEIVKPEGGKVSDKAAAEKIYNNVKDSDLEAFSVKKGNGSRKPAPPFTTSTMQQEASRRLGFTTRTTTRVAQQLYEGVNI